MCGAETNYLSKYVLPNFQIDASPVCLNCGSFASVSGTALCILFGSHALLKGGTLNAYVRHHALTALLYDVLILILHIFLA